MWLENEEPSRLQRRHPSASKKGASYTIASEPFAKRYSKCALLNIQGSTKRWAQGWLTF